MNQIDLKANNTQLESIEQKDIAKTNFVGFQVDGKIINELSNQVSSHLFAIGELMKNSYDAKATKILISLNINENILTIEDNGDGISQDNIQSLFHIAKSYKKYGEIYKFNILRNIKSNNGKLFLHKILRNVDKKDNTLTASKEEVSRLVQGSKGLGLLSAFKFGNIVEWNTMNNGNSISIVANKNNILNEDDITKVKFIINNGQKKSKGTVIKIFLDPKDDEIEFIYNFFSNRNNNEKLVNFFFDDNIEINLNLIGKNPNEKIKNVKTFQKSILNTELDSNKIFNLIYDSESNIFYYHYKVGGKFKTEIIQYNKKINNNDYLIKIRANAYSLKSNGKNKFSSIFKNNNNDLSPLVYINGVLFNNDQLFNPTITRSIRSSESLPQITGFVEIFCTNPSLEFNNERTDLIVNSFNSKLREDIKNLNIFLQKIGKRLELKIKSEQKKLTENANLFSDHLSFSSTNSNASNGDDYSSTVNPDNSDPDASNGDDYSSTMNPDNSDPDASNGDDYSSTVNPCNSDPDTSNTINPCNSDRDDSSSILNTDTTPTQFNIKLSTKKQTLTPKEFPYTINLGNYFLNAVDSKGNAILLDKIKITVDGKKLNHPFIEQIEEPKSINICYYFEDPFLNASNENPIKCCQYLTLIFNKKDSQFNIRKYSPPLIEPIALSYEFRLNNVGKLIDQINKLWADNEEYDMCIASSIRVIFDLTTFHYEILRAENPNHQNLPLPKGLEKQVAFIIKEITSDNHTYSKLSQLLSPRHSIVKNIFEEPEDFSKKVSQSNLGSHTGLTHSSLEIFAEIARFAGQYAQLVDAYCRTKNWIV